MLLDDDVVLDDCHLLSLCVSLLVPCKGRKFLNFLRDLLMEKFIMCNKRVVVCFGW